mmetsp:Transcript_44076/g.87012  ORF Transcript_44076/g.87012 Transcript_44076/m.87012 type:complete len:111 (-) Transcript_44076:289-621(-)
MRQDILHHACSCADRCLSLKVNREGKGRGGMNIKMSSCIQGSCMERLLRGGRMLGVAEETHSVPWETGVKERENHTCMYDLSEVRAWCSAARVYIQFDQTDTDRNKADDD